MRPDVEADMLRDAVPEEFVRAVAERSRAPKVNAEVGR